MRPSEVKDTWCQTAAVVCSALTLVCKKALEGRLKLKEQCIVIFPSLAHKTLPFVMPYNKRREIPESDEVLISISIYIYASIYICIYIHMNIYTNKCICVCGKAEKVMVLGFQLLQGKQPGRQSVTYACNEILR